MRSQASSWALPQGHPPPAPRAGGGRSHCGGGGWDLGVADGRPVGPGLAMPGQVSDQAAAAAASKTRPGVGEDLRGGGAGLWPGGPGLWPGGPDF